MSISRRTFLGTSAIGSVAAGAGLKTAMPTRILGRTGGKVSILGIGTGPTATRTIKQDEVAELVTWALDRGVSYIDTAVVYGNGTSERAVGDVMKTRRNQVWLTTKIQDRNYDNIMRMMDESLKRLQTDHVDLLHIHNLEKADDLAKVEAPQGALKAAYKIREQKLARFIGITSHTDPAVLKEALERHDFDCVQMSLNAAHSGAAASVDHSFEKLALPVALKKNMGVLAMKVFVGKQLLKGATQEELIRYSLSLPVASAVVGMPTLKIIEENTQIAKVFEAMPPAEMKGLTERVNRTVKASLDQFFRHHQDA